MINFSDLKQSRIRKTLEFNGETINILNPTKEIKEKIEKMVGKYSKIKNNTVEIDMEYKDNPMFAKDMFETLVEGITFPDDIEDFKKVMDDPEPIVVEIQYELEDIARNIGIQRALAIRNELRSTKDLQVVGDLMEELDDFAKENKNFKIPEIIVNENKKDITPKPKAKPKRKSTKKTTKQENEDVKEKNKKMKTEENINGEENGLQ